MKSESPLVSILLNCYNAEKFISKAIESVLNQTYDNWELIVWDDGSTDNTLEIVKRFKNEKIFIYDFIHIIFCFIDWLSNCLKEN